MRKKSALWVIGLLVAAGVIGIAVYMGQSQEQKGSLTGLRNRDVAEQYFIYVIANDEYPVYTIKFNEPTSQVKFDLLDSNNNAVKTVCQDANKDTYTCDWDGTGANNEDLASSGMYKFRVSYGPAFRSHVDSNPFKVISEDIMEDEEE